MTIPFILVASLVALVPTYGYFASNLCLKNIKEDNYSEIVASCSFYSVQTLEELAYVGDKPVFHSFGSYVIPSEKFELVKKKAKSGNSFYQRYLWLIYDIYYVRTIFKQNSYVRDRFNSDLHNQFRLAVEGGFVPALEQNVISVLKSNYSGYEQTKQALMLANSLVSRGSSRSQELLVLSTNSTVRVSAFELYEEQSRNLEILTDEELENLLFAFETGEYTYRRSDFEQGISQKSDYIESIRVRPYPEKIAQVKYLLSPASRSIHRPFRPSRFVED